jgi:hypothetical protein
MVVRLDQLTDQEAVLDLLLMVGMGTLTRIWPARPGVSISSVRTNGFIGSGVPVFEEDGVVVMGGRTGPGTGGRAT